MADNSRLATWIIQRLRKRKVRFRRTLRLFSFGAIYHGTYTNYKTDPRPLIFIMFSNESHTHAININHLGPADRVWLLNTIYLIKKGNQVIDPSTFYKLFKIRRRTIIQTGYRIYFTAYLKMRLVSPGITRINKLLYRSENPWVSNLNQKISPQGLQEAAPIAYSTEELRNKILEAHNSISIERQTVENQGAFGRATYLK